MFAIGVLRRLLFGNKHKTVYDFNFDIDGIKRRFRRRVGVIYLRRDILGNTRDVRIADVTEQKSNHIIGIVALTKFYVVVNLVANAKFTFDCNVGKRGVVVYFARQKPEFRVGRTATCVEIERCISKSDIA